jgi:hypothetical protein
MRTSIDFSSEPPRLVFRVYRGPVTLAATINLFRRELHLVLPYAPITEVIMNTKAAKDYLVQQTVEQAALEHVPLTDLETRMMYFTESDPASCDDPIALNDEFEQEYDTPDYEAKMSRLLHHAYKRLKQEDPERARQWNATIRVLRRGDHYFLVLWDIKPPTDHPVRDFFKLIGAGLLVVAALGIAIFFAAKYNVDLDRYGKYVPIAAVVLTLLVSGVFPLIYKLLFIRFHRETKEDKAPN